MAERMWALAKSAVFVAVFIPLWMVWMPRWLRLPGPAQPLAEQPWRWLGLLAMGPGAVIALTCIANFVFTGRGTPAPFDPPRRLVTRGLYRYVRNPMYVGMALLLTGEAILFADFSPALIAYAASLLAAVNLFVVFYEEPTLRRKFGADYDVYCVNVRRWIPRLRPWAGAPMSEAAEAGK